VVLVARLAAFSANLVNGRTGMMLGAPVVRGSNGFNFKNTVGRFVEIAPCEQSYTDAGA
jgi:hypothetical protein